MSPETRALLERVRDAEDPSAEDEERVLAAVRASVAAGALAGVATAGSSKLFKLMATWGLPGLKTGPVVLCVLAAAGAAELPVASERSEPSSVVAPLRAALPRGATAAREAVVPAPTAAPAPVLEIAAAPRAARPTRATQTPPSVAEASSAPSLRRELLLLSDVQRLLKEGDAGAALQRLDQHTTVDRELAAERRAARILALCAAGRTEEARQGAAELLREHPTSLQRDAVSRSCAGKR